jgi:hypothetical protein
MTCPVPGCGQDHLEKDGVLKVIHGIETSKLVYDYMALLTELGVSMQSDAIGNRKGAFITRLRDCEECYFKGLWVGLMATPEEIVHDASGERPRRMLAKLEKIVSETVFNEETRLSATLVGPSSTKFKAMDVLNTSTHLTALFLLHRSHLTDMDAKDMYAKALKHIHVEAAHLKYVSEALECGKDKKDIICGIRSMRKDTYPPKGNTE